MNAISTFTFHNNNDIRVIDIDNELWFVATDVANALDYPSAAHIARNLDDDEKGIHNLYTLGGSQEMLIINESGLYSAILRSRKPEAKKFKKWVTSEVLPAIRKTGKYEQPTQQPLPLIPVPFQKGRYLVVCDETGTTIHDVNDYDCVKKGLMQKFYDEWDVATKSMFRMFGATFAEVNYIQNRNEELPIITKLVQAK